MEIRQDMNPPSGDRPARRGFLGYCSTEALFVRRLQTQLAACRDSSSLDLWDEARLPAGSLWEHELADALANASFAVLFVSPDFLASPFISIYQLPHLLHAAHTGGTRIISIIARPCPFELSSLADFRPVNPPPAKPLVALSTYTRDQFLADLVRSLHQLPR